MKPDNTLTITSLLAIVLMTFHLTDDVVRGFEPGGLKNLIGVLILVVWLYATLVLAGQRSGRHPPPRVVLRGHHAGRPHVRGGRRRRDRRVQRRLLLHLDADRARRDRDLLADPLGTRIVAPATGSARRVTGSREA